MSWRLAHSLETLRDEVLAFSPNQTIYTIGDASHQAQASDHNPNSAGVVCAVDIMQGNDLDMGTLAERIRGRQHPDGKYVIYSYRIASANKGWAWRQYTGSDPHTDHIHVSVGVGPDGQSTQPYDDTFSWLFPGGTTPPPTGLGGNMLMLIKDKATGEYWLADGIHRRLIPPDQFDTVKWVVANQGAYQNGTEVDAPWAFGIPLTESDAPPPGDLPPHTHDLTVSGTVGAAHPEA